MADMWALEAFSDEDPRDFLELVIVCGKLIDAWLDAGGEPTDEAIAGFYSLWAQSLDLSGPIGERKDQETAFYAWAYPTFIRCRNDVRELFRGPPARA